ncbi:MAG TPA: hypothetical protein VMF55_15880 [Solirubrobacterales bacterium]|nr:hypothetical protein [Solirubrobacterales bacterium]
MTAASLAAYAEGQERLSRAVLGACAPGETLSAKVDAALTAAFSLLASDPVLAFLLTDLPERGDPALLRLRSDWRSRYGELLRDAALRDGAEAPRFVLEPTLIAGVAFSVARLVREGEAGSLVDRLLPAARWYLLSYYLPPEQVTQLGAAAFPAPSIRPRPLPETSSP